ncbi:hypothetical protein LguiA_015784 [Lonicera macranthoides]
MAMEPVEMEINGTKQVSPDHLPFARSYQLEALEKAIKQNTIVFLETGSGKTLIAIMLLRSYAYLLRKPSPYIAVFLVPTVVLVSQQAGVVQMHTDLKVGKYWGAMGVDFWDAATWKKEQDEYEVLVMTPKILLDALRHSFLKLEMIRVLIFDECHNAKGKHPYACIMKEFYHRLLATKYQPPRILGMTASLVKAKGSGFALDYWKQIRELENLMNSKIYTCVNESVLAEYMPSSTTKLKLYEDMDIPSTLSKGLMHALTSLREKYELSIERSTILETSAESAKLRLTKLFNNFEFCMKELGVWLAFKAAESLSCDDENDTFSWGKLDLCGETIARDFILDALKIFSSYLPSGPNWSIANDTEANVDAGYLTIKVICLIESLLEYRDLQDLRCIVFVERVITAIVLQTLLDELLLELTGWKTEYAAGSTCKLQSQSRKKQNKIVDEFRKGAVNIIVATSMLEEGLDVQSCNLVIRFDPSTTVCSFIQSRGRARMQDSVFLLLVKRGDNSTLAQVKNYLVSGDLMRQESLSHASIPCEPLDGDLSNEIFYRVETTGALATLSSSVSLIYFYCSRLPSDGYFKPSPRCHIDKESETCTLYLPKSCPLQSVTVQQNIKILKQFACLEACKQLHQIGALTDNLVPDIVVEEAGALKLERYLDEQMIFAAPELISQSSSDYQTLYHCYLIELERKFEYDIPVQDIVLAVRTKFDVDDQSLAFDLEVDRGNMGVHIKYVGVVHLASEQVVLCQRFQLCIFRVLLDHNLNKLDDVLNAFSLRNGLSVFDYLLLPSTGSPQKSISIDWKCVCSFLWDDPMNCSSPSCNGRLVKTKNCLTCLCMLENCLVSTPHNGRVYCTTGILYDLNGNSLLKLKDGEAITYKQYFLKKGIDLLFEGEPLINGRHIFPVQNHLLRCRQQKAREPSNSSVELPPELCSIIMSPISVSTFFSFSFVPSIMHRIESLLIASNLKKIHADHCMQNVNIPTFKVLEAITTKRCQEKYHLESMETLGDSFLKYAASQQLFMMHQNHHEGLLSVKKEKIISNAALCKLGCDMKLAGFIRTEPFDPKSWIIPGDYSEKYELSEEFFYSTRKVYIRGRRQIKGKVVADVVEALIGAFLSSGGEVAAIQFMKWIGIKVGFTDVPYERKFSIHPEMHINIPHLESLLNYSFHDASLLVEALTHGSYMLPEIPRCYQRLEFLGDAVLDYLVTMHLYEKYPGLSPGLLTDLRSASVNNDCYAQSAVKVGLHKHILHASKELHGQIVNTVQNFNGSSVESTYGWECEINFPKVLGDIIESLAGAILVDSGYNKDIVFECIRPLLEPLITPQTVRLQPARELNDLCQKKNYIMKKPIVSCEKGVASITIEVDANGVIHKETCTATDKKMAKKLASKALLKALKEGISQ